MRIPGWGLRAEFDSTGSELNEYRLAELRPGSGLVASADGVDIMLRLVDGASGRVAAEMLMGGAETAALLDGLERVMR